MTEIIPAAPQEGNLTPIDWPPPGAPSALAAQSAFADVTPVPYEDPLSKITAQDLSDLAWDLVLFNDMDKRRILSSYKLDMDCMTRLTSLPLFVAETNNAKKALAADPHLGVRRMAKSFLIHRVSTLNELATSSMVEPNARLKAVDMLSRIAGLDKPTEEKSQGKGGVAVQINFGSALGANLGQSIVIGDI